MKEKIKCGLIQMDCTLGDKDANISHALTLANEAVNNKANLLIFPEMFNTGYELDYLEVKLPQLSESENNHPTIDAFREFCIQNNVDAAFTIPYFHTNPEGKPNISMIYMDNTGNILAIQDKNHLFGNEKNFFSLGNDYPVFETRFGTLGMMVCYDANFPEPARIVTLKGAEAILCTAAWRVQDIALFDMIMPMRAAENVSFLLANNRFGEDNGRYNPGHSQVCTPEGKILAFLGEKENILYAEIDLDEVKAIRKSIPYLQDIKSCEYPQVTIS